MYVEDRERSEEKRQEEKRREAKRSEEKRREDKEGYDQDRALPYLTSRLGKNRGTTETKTETEVR